MLIVFMIYIQNHLKWNYRLCVLFVVILIRIYEKIFHLKHSSNRNLTITNFKLKIKYDLIKTNNNILNRIQKLHITEISTKGIDFRCRS